MSLDNNVNISGNLTRDVEFRQTSQGSQVANLSIAVNESYKGKESDAWKESTHFFNIEIWGKRAETVREYKKGEFISVSGKLRTKQWETKNGEKRTDVFIQADEIKNRSRFLKSKQAATQSEVVVA